jgi:hypothetical protein
MEDSLRKVNITKEEGPIYVDIGNSQDENIIVGAIILFK